MHFRMIAIICSVLLIMAGRAQVQAQATISSVQPRSCKPGETTLLTLHGKDLKDNVRVLTSESSAEVRVESIEAQHAIVALTLPAGTPLGPLGLWIATADGPVQPKVVLVDDLPTVADNGNNRSRDSAQTVSTLCAIDGVCEGSQSDFYRITATEGQRVAFEVHTQQIRSKMDPVVRLLDASGIALHMADDDLVGPDCRFSYRFTAAGDYVIEIRDSRYAAGGEYHLRIGDFPIVSHAYPLAIRCGERSQVTFTGPDGNNVPSREVQVPAQSRSDTLSVAAKLPGGQSSAWASLSASNAPQVTESVADDGEGQRSTETLSFPIGISGQLLKPLERDSYLVRGVKGQLVRVSSRTRSLGCSTLLQMQLFNSANSKVAETVVSDADEWSFDFTFPDDAEYRLEVADLLQRGGDEFGYWIEIAPTATFSVALKADAKTQEIFAVEPVVGVSMIDLQIARFGYEGEIMLSLGEGSVGLRILDPRIPAKAKEARIYLVAEDDWKPESLAVVRLLAHAAENPEISCSVSSQSLHRLLEPHVPFPSDWNDGAMLLAGVATGEVLFSLEPASPAQFARPVKNHSVTINLKRIQAEFKAAVNFLGNALPTGWSLSTKADKDVYTATLTSNSDTSGEPPQIPLLIVSEFKGRARLERLNLPVEWIDPVRIELQLPNPMLAGTSTTARVSIVRQGRDPQPVTLKLANLPAGLIGPSEAITVAADQSQAQIELQVSPEIVASKDVAIGVEAACKFGGNDFTVSAKSNPLTVISSPKRLEVYPTEIALDGPKSRKPIIVTGFDEVDVPRDWTRDVRIVSANTAIAEVRANVIYPKANGDTEILVELGSLRQSVPVRVSDFELARPTAFESEVLVAFSKQGCNSGACHGSPSGKGNFRMSLRAFDKQLDELTVIREDFGRRINPLEPEQSLLLIKPTMKVAHGGGKQLRKDDAAYAILRDWIAEGAKADSVNAARCVRLEVYPQQKRILKRIAGGQQLAVTAHFADGSQRDVTHLVAYETSNTSVATVDKLGLVTAISRGEAAILVRFLEHIESVPLMFVEEVAGFEWKSPAPNNYVDELVNAKLQQLQYLPSDTCNDTEFLRRVYLDVIGILPLIEETQTFLNDTSIEKRAKLIDHLLDRDEYSKFWALKWGDLLRMTSKAVGDEGVYKYHRWVEDAIRINMPYDQFARQLLTATGSTLANPPANFFRTASDMNESVETISQLFLGARLQCAKCHNHPFERWTQDNYYGLGAFFQRVERRKTQRPGEMFVWTKPSGEVTQPRTGQVMKPWLPQVGSITPEEDQDRRQAFANWLVDANNPYFAKIEANRIWSQLFARGIVEPIDDFRDSNPPSNEPLLNALAQDFINSGFDRKHLLRTMLNSRTYQAGYQTNEFNDNDIMYFSHQEPRLLSAEQILDAVNQATGLTQTFGTLPAGTKATQLPAPDVVKVDFLTVFGQPERSTVCACERADDSNLGMAIELFNGPLIHEKLRDANNRFRKSLAAGRSAEEAVRELYLAAVCRQPSEIELKASLEHCQTRGDVASGLEDVCWALMNTDEFLFQH